MSSSVAQKDYSRRVTLDQVRSLGTSNTESLAQNKRPLNWKDFGILLDKKLVRKPSSSFSSSTELTPSALINALSNNSYLSQVVKFQICNSCNRPIGEDSLAQHYPKCVEMKQKKQESDAASAAAMNKRKRGRVANPLVEVEKSSVETSRGTTPTANTPTSSQTPRPKKKYKKSQMQKEKEAANAAAAAAAAAEAASNRANTAANAKRKKQTKLKNSSKGKGPVDVEKQCGVPLPSGGFCARSLTCKTHSMGAKRAVPGRSAPYDVLLQQYQKRNQAKLAASNALAAQRRENAQLSGLAIGDADTDGAGNLNVVLDPDEETHLVLEGLSKNYPIPLERKVTLPVSHRHRFLYMREAYANALITNGSATADSSASGADSTLANQAISGSIGGLQGRCALVNVDRFSESTQNYATIPGEMYQVRAPSKAILMTAHYNQQQQVAFQQQILKLQQQQQLLAKQRQQSQGQPMEQQKA